MAHRLKILMVCPQFRPIVGGYERAAERLSVELGRRGHDVTVLAERRSSEWPDEERGDAFVLRRLWCVYRPGFHLLTSLLAYAAYLVLNGHRFDVFHVHQYGHHAALTIAWSWVLAKPVVLKITNTGAQGIKHSLDDGSRGARLLVFIHRQVDACCATTDTGLMEAVRFGISQDRISVIPNGIDLDKYRSCSLVERNTLKDGFHLNSGLTVLFSGRLASGKNVSGLLRAWRVVRRHVSGAQLILLGDGPLRSVIEREISSSDLEGSVLLCGKQIDVLRWYQVADVFVLPSHHEGLSNSMLEAMSCGVPVVSTAVSGSTDIFSSCDIGELVNVGDENALADALIRLLKNPERRVACGARARKYAENNFAIGEVARKLEQLYIRVLGRSGPVA